MTTTRAEVAIDRYCIEWKEAVAVHRYQHHAIQFSCATGWPVIHQDRGQAVRLRNRQIDPGWLHIRVELRLSGCTMGLVNSDQLYIRISLVTYQDS